jgi:hypothetical protein
MLVRLRRFSGLLVPDAWPDQLSVSGWCAFRRNTIKPSIRDIVKTLRLTRLKMSLGARHQRCGIEGSRPLGIHLRGWCENLGAPRAGKVSSARAYCARVVSVHIVDFLGSLQNL